MLVVRGGERSGGEAGVRRRFEKSGMCVEMKRIFIMCVYVCAGGCLCAFIGTRHIWWTNVITSCFSRRGIAKLRGHSLYYHEKNKDSRERSFSSPFFFSSSFFFFFFFFLGVGGFFFVMLYT